MKHVSLGGLDVSRIGLGAMTMAGTYTSGGGLDDAESIRAIHRALDLGVTPAESRLRPPGQIVPKAPCHLAGSAPHFVIATGVGLWRVGPVRHEPQTLACPGWGACAPGPV